MAARDRDDGEVSYGLTLSSEEQAPRDLVRYGARAEEAGFDFVSISDHYHPWVQAQGHSPFVWTVLGALSQSTEELEIAVGVTCPIVRIHPAVLAQAAATTSLLLAERFVFGLGTGEALNEHILGHRWPPPETRRQMLEEAVEVMRRLFTGETVDHWGRYYTVENARLFDPPESRIPLVISGFGDEAVELAGRIGDGFWGHSPEREVIERYEKAGGSGPRFAQLTLCWGPDEEECRQTAHRMWPTSGLSGQLAQDLPTWTHFDQATDPLTVEQTTGSTPCGPDIEPILDMVRSYRDAGYDHLYFHQIGPDQEGFIGFWESDLRPALSEQRSEMRRAG